ncbi:MAG: LysR family transcriptional regulator [Rhodoferax sp.]|nr:LysR family transcriptional regulator [Rhodoferax sp.]OIP19661.1 MAG: LysR family transcriptional regulator [Comamonadaceae bacterium CG2_30_60_41]PIW06748.1 MAG: LysR family transcriptional regulator [Comamonadaceae bacterium CG17_big_fil_post_rev_8_21_14_2_50_60_13]PIY24543.1 MAG: LysR family transcriptional regulator [Comamonadaceae bacterium CG_4_10_14_3_um_filter_60_75]PJC19280.1 MAG: LysR family transcriptional regulator [Comamonadaceae bacterium CG_4_9_14_0_8_um_filter_60_18]
MRRKIPSLQALMCFDAAARHQSYTRAAQELALTQGAVSRQLTALEDFLGVALFKRTRHGVALTASGRDYAQQVATRLAALEQDTLDVMSTQGRGSVLALAAVPTFATRWLIPRLPSLKAQHPDLTVHIDTRTRPFLFADTRFDAALFAGTPEQVANWAGTQAVKLLDEDVLPVCTPQWLGGQANLSPQDITAMPLLQQSTRPLAWRQWFDAQGVAAPQALAGPRFELFSMTAAAAVHGLGLALVPRLLISGELARGELVVACNAPLPGARAYYLVLPEGSDNPPVVHIFQHWLLTAAASPR